MVVGGGGAIVRSSCQYVHAAAEGLQAEGGMLTWGGGGVDMGVDLDVALDAVGIVRSQPDVYSEQLRTKLLSSSSKDCTYLI